MELTDLSTLSYDYGSVSTSEETEIDCVVNENEREITYVQEGTLDPHDEQRETAKLNNWQKWLKHRKGQYGRLKTILKRDVDNMVMNSEDVYKKRCNERLIDYAYKYITFDKHRGDPKFWITPNYIYDDCNKEMALNCAVQEKFDRTVIDKNEPPTLEYIGIPLLTKYEKGLKTNLDLKEKDMAHKCDYFNERKMKLKVNVDKIEKFVPDTDNLYVIGEQVPLIAPQIVQSTTDFSLDTVIIVGSLRESSDDNECHGDYTCSDVDRRWPILKIQDKIIDKNVMSNSEGDVEHVIQFPNCSTNEIYSGKLVIENIGKICVRYVWEKVDSQQNPKFPLQCSTQLVKRFFFPTKSNIFIPGQITEIPFWFKSRDSGLYQETWALTLDPKFSTDKYIKLFLRSFVKAEIDRTELWNIESYIEKCRATSASRNLMHGVYVDSELGNVIPYDSLFMFKDVFLHNNPDHFYESQKVNALMELYEKVPSLAKWNLSIITLRNNILNNVEVLEDKRKYLVELYEISNSLLKMNIESYIDKEKYRGVYQILCTFANMVERDSNNLRVAYRIGDYAKSSVLSLETIEEQSIDDAIPKTSLRTSMKRSNSRLSFRQSSRISNTASGKRRKSISSLSKSDIASRSSIRSSSSVIEPSSVTEVQQDTTEQDKWNSPYIKTLSVKTRQHLFTAIDEITAVIESLNMFIKPK